MPHLLVPVLREALVASPARKRSLTLNLVMHTGETEGFSAENHLEVLAAHAPSLTLDVVLADPSVVDDAAVLRSVAAGLGAELVVAPVGRCTVRRATTTRCAWPRPTATSSADAVGRPHVASTGAGH